MRIGVISDTHITSKSDALPKEIIEAFKDVDMIIHAGDLVNLSALEKLKQLCKNIKAVCGNMDSQDVKSTLPTKEIITVGIHKIGVTHGYGSVVSIRERITEIFKVHKVDIIIYGHSHMPFNEIINNILYFNPGSPTDKIFAPYNSYGILEINDKIVAKIIKITY